MIQCAQTLVNPSIVAKAVYSLEPRYEIIEGHDDPVRMGERYVVSLVLLDGTYVKFAEFERERDATRALRVLERAVDRATGGRRVAPRVRRGGER